VRVAVYLRAASPFLGGAYTFQENVHDALVRWAPKSKHEFIVFTDAALPPHCPESSGLTYRRFAPWGLARLRNRTARQLNSVQDSFLGRRLHSFQTPFQSALQGLGIHVVWYVTPSFQECGMPYVYTLWDLQHVLQPWFPEVSKNGTWELRESGFRQTILRATRVIVPNAQGEAELLRSFPIGAERILRLAHPTPEFALQKHPDASADTLRKYGLARPYLLYPAQFWPHKNHATLLEAVAALQREGLVFSLAFAGSDNGNESYVRALAKRMGLDNQVHFLGFVPTPDLVGLYQGAFALTYVTYFGPENLPPLEAFGLGCPVIASNVPGAEEQLGDAALLVEPTDAIGLATAIKRLDQEPSLREQLVTRGYRRARRCTSDDYVRGVLHFLDEFEPVRRCWD
jgi:glycosyltransferase involved in cell wall biosynthesis